MLNRSFIQVVRAAESTIARAALKNRMPRVIWRGLSETDEDFALRCARLQLAGADRVLAAMPYGSPVPAGVQGVPFAPKLFRLLHPATPSRYRVASGGRGSAKSHAFATAIILWVIAKGLRVLCCREVMNSLRESVHHLLCAKIDSLGLTPFFGITDRELECTATGAQIIFAGLHANVNALKSLEGVSLCWVEEGESVSKRSFEVLTPTIRSPGSEIWMSVNPDALDAPIMEFIDEPRPDTLHQHLTFESNPWFPPELEGERVYLQRVDPDAYAHVWLGQCRTHSDAQVFKGKYRIEEFTPHLDALKQPCRWDGPYLGADFGFAVDPSTLIKAWIYQRVLYIEHETYGIGVDTNRLPALYDAVPDARKYVIRADSARPETISALRQDGFPGMTSVDKWKGSVEDGIAFIRSFEKVVIHTRCARTAEEFRLCSYKVDRLTSDVLPDLVGKNDHCIDALRYALAPVIQRRRKAQFSRSDHMIR